MRDSGRRLIPLTTMLAILAACGGGGVSSAPAPLGNSFCDSLSFADPATTPYVLPWAPGSTYTMFQGNCSSLGGHRDTFAYDFDLNMGDPIYASRAGEVIVSNDQYADTDHVEGHENNVFVEHSDNTVIRYTHLMEGSAAVLVGQQVTIGDLLGLAGNSGNSSGPHLHMQGFRDRTSFNKPNAIPLSFSNAIGTTESSGELIEGNSYEAGPYP